MIQPQNRLKTIRERSGKSPQDLAIAAGISVPAYYDLEDSDELFNNISLGELGKMCATLGIHARDLFDDDQNSVNSIDFKQLSERLKLYLHERKMSRETFEAIAGWSLSTFGENPEVAWTWTVDCLRDVCGILGIDWLSALPH